MKLRFSLQAQAAPIFRKMAQEAGLSVNDLAEIACYALIGTWQREHGVELTKLDASNGEASEASHTVFVSAPPADCLLNR